MIVSTCFNNLWDRSMHRFLQQSYISWCFHRFKPCCEIFAFKLTFHSIFEPNGMLRHVLHLCLQGESSVWLNTRPPVGWGFKHCFRIYQQFIDSANCKIEACSSMQLLHLADNTFHTHRTLEEYLWFIATKLGLRKQIERSRKQQSHTANSFSHVMGLRLRALRRNPFVWGWKYSSASRFLPLYVAKLTDFQSDSI